MKTTMRTMCLGLGLGALALGACDSGDKGKAESKPKAADKAGADKAGAEVAADKAVEKVAAVQDDGETEVAAKDEGSEQDVLDALDERVTRAAKLAREIGDKPENADEILEAADLDRAGFEALIFTIGADAELSKQYQLAMSDP